MNKDYKDMLTTAKGLVYAFTRLDPFTQMKYKLGEPEFISDILTILEATSAEAPEDLRGEFLRAREYLVGALDEATGLAKTKGE